MLLSANLRVLSRTWVLTVHRSTSLPHEITQVGRDLQRSPHPASCSERLTVKEAARGLMPVGSEYLQGRRILQPPWATCLLHCLTTLTAKNKLLYQVRISHVPTHLYCLLSFHCVPLRRVWLHLLCTLPSVAAYNRGGFPLKPPLFRAEQAQFSQPLLLHHELQPPKILAALHWTCFSMSVSFL